jgi:hypothetical protein
MSGVLQMSITEFEELQEAGNSYGSDQIKVGTKGSILPQ